ncbi:hypothetical protein EAI_06905 [Harpegnathos saltator]|uniref:Uncharacterized protein n=1 Tax=Harpegnathos saltator TaxID=610380 RepID=E2C9C3_HARSA|nr:hypothetical protein EAI_06905 [Harpegnathos saltator]
MRRFRRGNLLSPLRRDRAESSGSRDDRSRRETRKSEKKRARGDIRGGLGRTKLAESVCGVEQVLACRDRDRDRGYAEGGAVLGATDTDIAVIDTASSDLSGSALADQGLPSHVLVLHHHQAAPAADGAPHVTAAACSSRRDTRYLEPPPPRGRARDHEGELA